MYGGMWFVGVECNAVVSRATGYALTKSPCVNKYVTALPCRTFSSLPRLGEECLTLKILIKLAAKFHPDVVEYIPEHFPDL